MENYKLGRLGSELILPGDTYEGKAYQIRVLKDTVFSQVKSGEEGDVDEAGTFGIASPRVVPMGDIITANGDDFFTKVVVTSGAVRCYNA